VRKKIVELTEENLNENGIAELLADGGYSSGSFKIFAPKKHRCLYSKLRTVQTQAEGFIFNKELNQYECIKEKVPTRPFYYLKAKKTIAKLHQIQLSVVTRLQKLSLREQCCGKALSTKMIDHSIHKEHYDQMHQN
jgi:hypothetical protein